MESFRKTLLAVIVGLIVILSFALYAIVSHTTCPIREGFLSFSVPRDIPVDYREDVEEFVNNYSDLAQKVCAVQNVVIDGIAKTLAGPQGTPNLAQAQVRAKAMANGQLFDCGKFTKQTAAFTKNEPTIKDFYGFFDDIPDNIGYRLWNSAKFSRDQILETYQKVNSSISSATSGVTTKEGFADTPSQQPSRCASQELCPEEMAKKIVERLNKLKASLQQAKNGFYVPVNPEKPLNSQSRLLEIQTIIDEATNIKNKLDDIKKKAETGQLLPSQPPSEKQPPSA